MKKISVNSHLGVNYLLHIGIDTYLFTIMLTEMRKICTINMTRLRIKVT